MMSERVEEAATRRPLRRTLHDLTGCLGGRTPLIIRVDAGGERGIGHAMRCLALAESWKDAGGEALFTTAECPSWLLSRLQVEGFPHVPLAVPAASSEDAAATRALAREIDASWLVVDGYHFDRTYHLRARPEATRLAVVDDYGQVGTYEADVVIDQNLDADSSLYAAGAQSASLLLGPRYALLRREFQDWLGWKRVVTADAGRLLVSMGGAAGGWGPSLRNSLLRNGIKEAILVGEELTPEGNASASMRAVSIRRAARTADMAELMAWADVALLAAGSTVWEAAFMGLPSLLLIRAPNQRPVAEAAERAGVAWSLGWYENVTSAHEHVSPASVAGAVERLCGDLEGRREMARRGQALVDGEGASRVVTRLRAEPLRLRRVREEDCRLLWEWANDPEVRAASFSGDPIPWERHTQWFVAKLQDPRCLLFLALDANEDPVGQVRFEVEGGEAVVSVSLDRRFRGKEYGSALLSLSSQKVFATRSDVTVLRAFIKPGNDVSVRPFQNAAFHETAPATVRGQPARQFLRGRDESQRRTRDTAGEA